jgi:SagB-type dehydrogenase family enzyme
MHAASSLASGAEARAWRAGTGQAMTPAPSGTTVPLRPLDAAEMPTDAIDDVIARRRSNRHYQAETPLPLAALSTALMRSWQGTDIDCLPADAGALFTPYLIVNNVEGVAPGAYAVHAKDGVLELLQSGDMRQAAIDLACDQGYAGAAHVNAYPMTALEPVLARFGNRGYRLAQLEAALFGAKLQLAAHALGLGAVGSTSYDDEVTAHFSPHAAGKSFMFVAVCGNRRRPSSAEIAEKSTFLQGDKGVRTRVQA